NDFYASSYQRAVSSNQINFAGDLAETKLNSSLIADGNELQLQASLKDLGQSKRSIRADMALPKIEAERYWPALEGQVSATAAISGALLQPDIFVQATATEITAYQQQIPYLSASAEVGFDQLDFTLHQLQWEDNLASGFGVYDYQTGLSAQLQIPDFRYQKDQYEMRADLQADVAYDEILQANLALSELILASDDLVMDQLQLDAALRDDQLKIDLTRPTNDISLQLETDLQAENILGSLDFNRFDLNRYFQKYDLPRLSGNFLFQKDSAEIWIDSALRIFDQDFGKLDGRLITKAQVDLEAETIKLNFDTDKTKFNYEPFKINLAAAGTFEKIQTTKFLINDEINLNLWVDRADSLTYGAKVEADSVQLYNYLKYVMHSYTANQISGNLDLNLNYDSSYQNSIMGNAKLSDFSYDEMEKLQAEMSFSGNPQALDLEQFQIRHANKTLLDIGGKLSANPDFNVELTGKVTAFDPSEIIPDSPLQGEIFADLAYRYATDSSQFDLDLSAEDLTVSQQKIDSFDLSVTQYPQILEIKKLSAFTKNRFELLGGGKVNYNFLTSTAYPDSHSFDLNFSGDLFRMLARELDFIKSGRSRSSIDLKLGIAENGFSVKSGKIKIDQAYLDIANQLLPLDKVDILLNFSDNIMDIEEFNFRFGEGRLYVDNEIGETDNFVLGMLNLGKFKVHTSASGILSHIPGFMPSNSFAKIEISGRDQKDLLISGPFEDTKILGNVILSNGDAIFPPDTENVMKLFTRMRSNADAKKPVFEAETEKKDLPFTLDLIIDLQENVRYVTYPANLKISSDSFLRLKYSAGEFKIPEALFICEEGSANIFGTQMRTDFLKIQINEYQQGVEIVGNFYKQAADGTIITFEIFDDSSAQEKMNLQFQLISDNASDGILDILSLLRYGRRVDDIAEGQKKTLLQDEVVNIIGVGLESALLDPLISPVENWIRNTLRLDFFYLSTDLVQNVVSTFISSSDEQLLLTNEPGQDFNSFAYDDFLDNLSINAGKYLTRRLFADYEARIEKSYDLNYRTRTGVYQFYSLRYDLPLKFRLIYQYNLQPFDEDSHQITLEKSFRF
ncbi:MAG: hypothetical protein R6U84_00930, partial [Candidatus Cloacimonadales bacterium]